jgi:hypothetical protein
MQRPIFSFWLRLGERREDDETWPYSTDTMGRKLFSNLDQFVAVLPLDHQSRVHLCTKFSLSVRRIVV